MQDVLELEEKVILEDTIALIYTTTNDESVAKKIAEALVSEKLSACIQFFPIQSVYVWNEKLKQEQEFLLIIKTLESRVCETKDRILSLHNYETPELIVVNAADVGEGYGKWIRGVLQRF